MIFLPIVTSVLVCFAQDTLKAHNLQRFAVNDSCIPASFVQATLRQGTYKWVSGDACCDLFTPTLHLKQYHQTHYYLDLNCVDSMGKPRRVNQSCCPLTFLFDWQAGKTTVIQKSDPMLADSFQLQIKGDLLWLRHFCKQQLSGLEVIEQQFKYVGEIQHPLFNLDYTNAYAYEPKFRGTISMKCYEYPDTRLLPRRFQFKSENWVVQRAGVYEVQSEETSFYLIYFDLKPNSLFRGRYEDYNQHLWIRRKDFLKYFSPVKWGRL